MSVDFRASATRSLTQTWAALRPWAEFGLDWVLEHAPVFGRQAVQRRRRVVVGPYARSPSLLITLITLLAVPVGLLSCIVYGFFFGLTAPYLIVPCVIPIAFLAVMIVWALPDQRTAPTLPIEFLLPSFFIFMILWPEYLAISLPGLPWITMLRIVGLPMASFFLVSLSVSKQFRRLVYESVNSIKLLWFFVCGFVLLQIITLGVSKSPFASAQLVFNQQIYWTCIFVISCCVFRKDKMVERYFALLCALSVIIVALTAIEFRRQHILWAAHIPRILRIPDPSVQNTLAPSFRIYTNVYRAKATFSTPLGLAEYISLLTPFWLHFGFSRINTFLRLFCLAMIPLTFIAVRMTDCRLGVVGVLASLLLYGFLWSIVRWRSHPRDLLAAATIYAYPAIFLAGLGVIFSSHRLKAMVFGDGAQASSTAARETQLQMAFSKLGSHPFGYGTGQSGHAMGYAKDVGITIDNYFISILLEYGIPGIIIWYGMFVIGIVVAVRYCLSPKFGARPEARLLAPIAVCLTAFLVVKWVHGQSDNHPVYFMMLGMISALVYRLKNNQPISSTTQALS